MYKIWSDKRYLQGGENDNYKLNQATEEHSTQYADDIKLTNLCIYTRECKSCIRKMCVHRCDAALTYLFSKL